MSAGHGQVLKRSIETGLAFLVGVTGGALFYYFRVPLPWTLGSLLATAIVVISGRNWLMPPSFRDMARPLVGVLAGSAFVPTVVAALVKSWPVVAFAASYTIMITALGFLFFRKFCKLDRVTAFFASTPGGLSELILIGAQLGGNMRTLVMVHTIRIVTVVFTVPIGIQIMTHVYLSGGSLAAAGHGAMELADWLIIAGCCAVGYLAAAYLRIPGGAIIASLVASAALHATGLTRAVPPAWLVALVQIIIGASAGARFAGIRWIEVRRTVFFGAIWAIIMLCAAASMAFAGSLMFDRTFPALLLAISPGGLPEMTIVTYALGIDVAFVITCHVCRIFLVLTLAPPICQWIKRRYGSGME